MTVKEKLEKPGPRKLLALDGGGIRGILAVEVLAAIEQLLQRALGRGEDFVLADYFDYIAGTSTGALIASCLSLGLRVADIQRFYVESGKQMFDKASLMQRYRYKFRNDKLGQLIQEVFGPDTTLGSERLRTLLLLILRNATTDSPWPISNNPRARYNDRALPNSNLQLPLWQLLLASTAAPTFFPPEDVSVGGHPFVFVDGGMTVYNNPAFLLFLMATVEPYRLSWPAGEEKMLLVSIGTGVSPHKAARELNKMNLLSTLSSIPGALMSGALHEQDFLCRVFGHCRVGDVLDAEVGDMRGARGPVTPKLFTYLRYDAELSRAGLDGLGLPEIVPEEVQHLDAVAHIPELQRIGRAVARTVRAEHFSGFLAGA